ncbi:MAG: methyltransferase domain-containing protein [Candidatus Omnitrophota bacterium]
MKKQLQTDIYSLAFGGDGVGKIDGKICFVKGAIPGEKVLLNVNKETPSYMKGDLAEILVPSDDRTPPACRYYDRCGGCQLQHISYEKELFYKKEQVVELVKRIAGVEKIECGDIVASSGPYHYRSSITLHKKGERYGFYAAGGFDGEIIEIEECPIAEEAINKELPLTDKGKSASEVTLKADHQGRVWSSGKSGERFFPDKYREMELYFSPKAFSQPNRYISEKIAEKLEEWIGPAGDDTAFFDAFCGVGFFSFLLKQVFGVRAGMDSSRISIECAKTTVKAQDLKNAKFHKGDVEKEFLPFFDKLKRRANVLLLDPPRKGVSGDFLDAIKSREDIDKIYYISCDPARMARDIKILTASSGWDLGRIQPFDMFPRTKHIETLAEFVRGKE